MNKDITKLSVLVLSIIASSAFAGIQKNADGSQRNLPDLIYIKNDTKQEVIINNQKVASDAIIQINTAMGSGLIEIRANAQDFVAAYNLEIPGQPVLEICSISRVNLSSIIAGNSHIE